MKPTTPLKAIRLKCLDCCCDNAAEVRRCHIEDCALHVFRMGHGLRWKTKSGTKNPHQEADFQREEEQQV